MNLEATSCKILACEAVGAPASKFGEGRKMGGKQKIGSGEWQGTFSLENKQTCIQSVQKCAVVKLQS